VDASALDAADSTATDNTAETLTLTSTGAGALSVTGGAGGDTITGGTGNDTINGAGDDGINSGKGLDVIDVGTGNDRVSVTPNDNGNIYATITGMGKGDTLDFEGTTGTFKPEKIVLAGTAAFADYLGAAAAGSADRIVWFQYGGDTYLVHDRDGGAVFLNGTDQVVRLVGLVDLSSATIGNNDAGAADNFLTLG
jgi:S-layer protein